jgi:hypothetical protein
MLLKAAAYLPGDQLFLVFLVETPHDSFWAPE